METSAPAIGRRSWSAMAVTSRASAWLKRMAWATWTATSTTTCLDFLEFEVLYDAENGQVRLPDSWQACRNRPRWCSCRWA